MISGGTSPEAIEKPLREYQKFAVEWLLERLYVQDAEGAGLFLDPGLGKTRTALTIAEALRDLGLVRRVLVVAPLRPVYTVWPAEVKRWGFDFNPIILHNQHARAMACDCNMELVNFEGLVKLVELGGRWDLLIVDESTFVKNWSTKRTRYMRKMVQKIPKRLILTGTPAANSLADLHAQLYVVDRGESLGKTAGTFRSLYCQQGGFKGYKWNVREGVGGRILDAIKDRVLRMKAEDHLDMPKLIFNEIWAKLPPNSFNQYKRLKRELYTELDNGADILVGSAAAAYTKCKQFANGQVYTMEGEERVTHRAHDEKVNALFELHEELAGKPLLVFYHFTSDLLRIQSAKGSPFKKCPVLRGGMKIEEVQKILDGWNAGKYHAILAQWQAASHGLNMQGCCNDVACFGLHDSLEIFDQAIRRVYRQGVTGDQVRIHRLLTLDTVDAVMLERLQLKDQTQSQFLEALKKHAKS
jgi:SNF2 family DNA or RNA helicase